MSTHHSIPIKYYLIHGIDPTRKPRMLDEFRRCGIDNEQVTWITYPNKDDLTPELIRSITTIPGSNLRSGQISCTYKHYLALQDIVHKQYPLALIIEDNIGFYNNVPHTIEGYLSQLPPEWDVLFDSDLLQYKQQPTTPQTVVYPKSNAIEGGYHGGTRGVACYLINLKCATKLYENFLPFNNVSDFWMNDLFRKLDIKSYWTHPTNVFVAPHSSTA